MLPDTSAQIWSYAPRYRRPRHFHLEPELNLVVAGSARFGVGDRVIDVGAGELLTFPPGQDHVLLSASNDLVLYAVGMAPSLCSAALRDCQILASMPYHLKLPLHEFHQLVQQASSMAECRDASQRGAEVWQRAHARRWLQASACGVALHSLTRRALETMQDRPTLGRSELARHLRADPSDISRYFHRDMGMTLVQYRVRVRLMRFIGDVDANFGNLTAAAVTAGFGSYSQCHRAFRAELDVAPREFFSSESRATMEQAFEPLDE